MRRGVTALRAYPGERELRRIDAVARDAEGTSRRPGARCTFTDPHGLGCGNERRPVKRGRSEADAHARHLAHRSIAHASWRPPAGSTLRPPGARCARRDPMNRRNRTHAVRSPPPGSPARATDARPCVRQPPLPRCVRVRCAERSIEAARLHTHPAPREETNPRRWRVRCAACVPRTKRRGRVRSLSPVRRRGECVRSACVLSRRKRGAGAARSHTRRERIPPFREMPRREAGSRAPRPAPRLRERSRFRTRYVAETASHG